MSRPAPVILSYVFTSLYIFPGLDHGGSDWVSAEILVKISMHYSDSDLADKVGKITSVSGHVCNVYVEELERVASITSEHLEPIIPEKGDKVCT